MLTIQKRVAVSAPPEKVYRLVDDARRLPELFPHLVDVEDVHPLPLGGHRFHYHYDAGDRGLVGNIQTVEQVRNRMLVDRAVGGLDATFRWSFTPREGVTEVGLEVESDGVDEQEAEEALAHLKAIAEA